MKVEQISDHITGEPGSVRVTTSMDGRTYEVEFDAYRRPRRVVCVSHGGRRRVTWTCFGPHSLTAACAVRCARSAMGWT